jgi:hypothetical protein
MFPSVQQIWDKAVERNRLALQGVVAQILGVLAAFGGADVARLPRGVHATILRVLRPAESALRRLIVIAARNVSVKPGPVPDAVTKATKRSPRKQASQMMFPLIDPRKKFRQQRASRKANVPRIYFIAPDAPFVPFAPQPSNPFERLADVAKDRTIGARRICLRIRAFAAALDDIPRQAMRLARLRMRKPNGLRPLRPGKPPGHRKILHYEIDRILSECHNYALGVLSEPKPDTS